MPVDTTFYTLTEVSWEVGVPYYRIRYAERIQALPEPKRHGNQRLYSAADIKRIREYFGVKERNGE